MSQHDQLKTETDGVVEDVSNSNNNYVVYPPGDYQVVVDEDDVQNKAVGYEQYDSSEMTQNKWAKNGFGAPVVKQNGKFSREESEIVRNAIEEYCSAKQISVGRLCSEHEHKSELKGAWMEIARHLPDRSVQSVYRHGIRRCHPFKRGAWSEEECRSLMELVNSMGKKWAVIQTKLNRSADSCRDKVSCRYQSDAFF